MPRYLLDTNILSNFTKPVPSRQLIDWLLKQENSDLFIASMNLAEIKRGILDKPEGKKRSQLEDWFASKAGPERLFAGRILPFDHSASLIWAKLMSDAGAAGKPRSFADTIIAATATAYQCILVTDNEKDFPGQPVFNPIRTN